MYHAFLSYSTAADYGLAAELQVILEGFHQHPAIRPHGVPPVRICRDGSEFRLTAVSGEDGIRSLIRPYLERSAALVILWPGAGLGGPFMDWELEEFVAQNQRLGLARPVFLAVTRGNPHEAADTFFSARQVTAGLRDAIYFDFRGRHPRSASWAKVRDFDAECLRLAVELANPRGADGARLSLGDLLPGWVRALEAQRQRERELEQKALARKAAVASGLARKAPVVALALAAEISEAVDGHESRRALADVLLAHAPLVTHLGRANAHIGAVQDVSFLRPGLVLSVDDGSGAINDERRGALCLWDASTGDLLRRDERAGGTHVAGVDASRLVVARGGSLLGIRWFDDGERFGFRSRWAVEFPFRIEHVCHDRATDLLALAGGNQVAVLRDGDAAAGPVFTLPGKVGALCWIGERYLAVAADDALTTIHISNGEQQRVEVGQRILDVTADASGGAYVLVSGRVLRVRDGVVTDQRPCWPLLSGTLHRVGSRLLASTGSAGNEAGPRVLSLDWSSGVITALYEDFRHPIHRLAVSPDGLRVAGARHDPMGSDGTRCMPLWEPGRTGGLPQRDLGLDAAPLACALPGTGFAVGRGEKVSSWDASGQPRWSKAFAADVEHLVACNGAVAVVSANVLELLAPEDGRTLRSTAFVDERLVSVTACAGGARLLCGGESGAAWLLDSAELGVIATARTRRHILLGNVTDVAPGPGVTVLGGAAWLDSPWVLLHPSNAVSRASRAPPAANADGVIQVPFDGPVICGGWGWWDTRTDVISWNVAGTLGLGLEGSLLGGPGGMVVSPLPAEGLGVAVYTLPRGAESDASPPEPSLSMEYDLPDGVIALLGNADRTLLVAQAFRELLLFAPDEAAAIARLPVPDDFRALTLTGDGGTLIASTHGHLVALPLQPSVWRQEARRKAGRELTAGERRSYLGNDWRHGTA